MTERALIIAVLVVGVVTLGILIRLSDGDLRTSDVVAASGFATGVALGYAVWRKNDG